MCDVTLLLHLSSPNMGHFGLLARFNWFLQKDSWLFISVHFVPAVSLSLFHSLAWDFAATLGFLSVQCMVRLLSKMLWQLFNLIWLHWLWLSTKLHRLLYMSLYKTYYSYRKWMPYPIGIFLLLDFFKRAGHIKCDVTPTISSAIEFKDRKTLLIKFGNEDTRFRPSFCYRK